MPPFTDKLMPVLAAVPLMLALVASNSREIPWPMKSPGAENIVSTMLLAETAEAALAGDTASTGAATSTWAMARITTANGTRVFRPSP